MQAFPRVTHGSELCKTSYGQLMGMKYVSHKLFPYSNFSLCITHGTEICMLVPHKMFPCSNFMQTFHQNMYAHITEVCVCKQSLIKEK